MGASKAIGTAWCSCSADTGRTRCVESSSSTIAREKPTKVVIVDDEEDARWILQNILSKSGEFKCVGSYSSGEEALREISRVNPQIVLMDIRLPGISGIECMRRLKAILPGLTIVLVSGLVDLETMSEALKLGGQDCLTKPFSFGQCLTMLRFAVGRKDSYTMILAKVDAPSTGGGVNVFRLTKREIEVMHGLVKGLLYKEIAVKLHISYSTVNQHQKQIFLKLHVGNRTEAVTKWISSERA